MTVSAGWRSVAAVPSGPCTALKRWPRSSLLADASALAALTKHGHDAGNDSDDQADGSADPVDEVLGSGDDRWHAARLGDATDIHAEVSAQDAGNARTPTVMTNRGQGRPLLFLGGWRPILAAK